jgi:CRP/FNR family transcriptional regulator
MKSTHGILSIIPLFDGLSEEELKNIFRISEEKTFNKGASIFFEGDQGNGFYAVIEGRVKIYKISPDGKEKILHIFGSGEPFGEIPVFIGKPFPANAMALEDSRVLFFPRKQFLTMLTENPSLSLSMLAVLCRRLREFTVQIENLALKEVPGRLASYLLYLTEEQGNAEEVELSISKGQLASLLGTIPETLSRILAKMSRQGIIKVDGRLIHVLDRYGLEELSQSGKSVIA